MKEVQLSLYSNDPSTPFSDLTQILISCRRGMEICSNGSPLSSPRSSTLKPL